MRNRVIIAGVAVVAVAALGAAGWFLFLRDDGGSGPPASATKLDIEGGERDARAACASLVRFEALVDQNASADAVQAELSTAQESAAAAATADPRWRSLSSGTDALVVAIDEDDPQAARVGIDVVRAQCESLR